MSEPLSNIAHAAVIVGLALCTFVTRTSFLVAGSRLKLRPRAEVALRYAPVCTLAAIIVPDILMHAPAYTFDTTFTNPRLIGALAAGVWLCFSRNIIGCLATGMLAYTAARLWLA
jgi:branched-subunit amino acid transport protein